MVSPHDVPSAAQLVEAVREWLQSEVLLSADGRLQYDARVAINVLAIVERELTTGPAQHAAHAARLSTLGMADDAALAAAIRAGVLDDRLDQVRSLVWESVRDKLSVANPKYLTSP